MAQYLFNLVLLGLVATSFSFWWNTLGIKQIALLAAQRRCDELGVQLLDETIVLRHFKLKRDHHSKSGGSMRVWRRFGFEFSTTGDARYHGRVDLLGKRIVDVQLEPHRI